MFGPSAEIVSQVVENCFQNLRKPPRRLGLPDHPTPSSQSLVTSFYPRAEHIAEVVCDLAEVSQGTRNKVTKYLSADRHSYPLDVPHPTFQGPF